MNWINSFLSHPFVNTVLTGIIIGLVLFIMNRYYEKRDIITSLSSELKRNYKAIKKIQDFSAVRQLDSSKGMLAAIRKDMPWNNELSDEDIVIDYFKNMPIEQELSFECWNKLQSQIAKYSKDYEKYEELYNTLEYIMRHSKSKSKFMVNKEIAEKAAINQFSAIRINSEKFIKKYEEFFVE